MGFAHIAELSRPGLETQSITKLKNHIIKPNRKISIQVSEKIKVSEFTPNTFQTAKAPKNTLKTHLIENYLKALSFALKT